MEGLDVAEGLRRIALAGVGAVAMGAERGEEAVDELVRRGERAVDQGKALNQELTHRARQAADDAGEAALRSRLAAMTADERHDYVRLVERLSADIDAATVHVDVEGGSGEGARR